MAVLSPKLFQRISQKLNKNLQTVYKDNKVAAEQQQPLTKDQIIQNTSMEPKPPGTPANTSGRPPVAPQGPEPVQASSLADQGQALNATSMPGARDPWSKPKSSNLIDWVMPGFGSSVREAAGLFSRFSSKDPYADKYELFPQEEEELNRYLTMNRRDFGNTLESKRQQGSLSQAKADRYRREYDRRRR